MTRFTVSIILMSQDKIIYLQDKVIYYQNSSATTNYRNLLEQLGLFHVHLFHLTVYFIIYIIVP
jgi:hypothetical protein